MNGLILVFPIESVERRELIFFLAQQDSAPVDRYHFKYRSEYFVLQFFGVAQEINARTNFAQGTQVSGHAFVFGFLQRLLSLVQEDPGTHLSGRLGDQIPIVKMNQPVRRKVFAILG